MTVLPIVERELRVTARRRATYWNRTASAGIAIGLFGLMFLVGAREPSRELGRNLFVALSVCFLVASLVAGVVYTADCLSEEKREGTLGLLFLTNLKGYDVVLGKLVSSSMAATYAILAIVPVLGIPLLMGGVSAAEFGRVVLVLVNTLFFSLAAGVLVSAWLRQGLTSMAVTLALVLAVNLLPPLSWVAVRMATDHPPSESWLVPSAGYAWAVASEASYLTREQTFLVSLAVTHGLAWMFLGLASRQVRRTWRERTDTVRASMASRIARWLRGSPEVQRRWRATALDSAPCYWLGGRVAYKAWVVWAVLGAIIALWLIAWAHWGRDWANEGVALLTVLALHTLLRTWLAGEATLGLGPDRRSGALELILCTDLGVPEIVGGRLQALQRQFLGPAVGVLLLDLLLLLGTLAETTGGGEEAAWWLSIYLVLMTVFVLDMVALAWLGLWWGLVCRQPSRALVRALALIFGLPFLLLATGLTGSIILSVEFPDPEWLSLGLVYLAVCGTVSVGGWVWARTRLLTRLRLTVAGESAPVASEGGLLPVSGGVGAATAVG